MTFRTWLVVAACLGAGRVEAQPASRPAPVPPPAALGADAPALAADNPFQCWWRASRGAVQLGEIVDVALTCAVLETGDVTAVADESRLTVAAVQLSPFEIVGGTHPPDVREGDRRFFQYRYQLRIITPDVVGRDVKLPPLAIPYKLQSRVGAATTMAGRDLVHLMPQLVFRVVSQVPADADDIRDGSDASLAEIERLRFRGRALTVTSTVLFVLGGLAAISALLPLTGLLRRRRPPSASRLSDRVVLQAASRRLADLHDTARSAGWTAETMSEAHAATRVVAALAMGAGVREAAVPPGGPVPEGRFVARRRFGRHGAAVTAHVTPASLTQALSGAAAENRDRLERLREALTTLTRTQYTPAGDVDAAAIDDAVTAARDIGAGMAREQLLSPRAWFRRQPPVAATPEF